MILFASFHNPAVVFEQLSFMYSLPRYLVRSFRLILPFFPTSTMEKIDREGQVVKYFYEEMELRGSSHL